MKKLLSVTLILMGLILLAKAGHAQDNKKILPAPPPSVATPPVSQPTAPTTNPLEILIAKAEALLKSGKPTEAYELLEPEEGEYSGEMGYDYLLGVAALDSGKPDRATIAFERVLIINPKFSGARLDLARAYFVMGSDDLAKKEFETVLTQSPPPPVIEVVNKFLAGIEERRKTKLQQISAYVESNVGYDDNITAATSNFTSGVQSAFGIPNVLPTGSSLRYKGAYENINAGFDFSRKVNEEKGVTFFAGADFKRRLYNVLASMNNTNLDLRAGVSIAQGENIYRLSTTYGKYLQNGFPTDSNPFPNNSNRNTAGISTEWKRSFGVSNQMTWSLQYNQPRYETAPTQDTNQISLGASWLHIYDGDKTPLVFVNLTRSTDRALIALDSGAKMDRTSTSLMVHSQLTPKNYMDFFLSGGLTVRHDDSPNARSMLQATGTDLYAQDVTQNLSTGVTVRPWSKWTVKAMVAWTNNLSNVELYKYKKLDSSISIRRDF